MGISLTGVGKPIRESSETGHAANDQLSVYGRLVFCQLIYRKTENDLHHGRLLAESGYLLSQQNNLMLPRISRRSSADG
jgi:hypothetical protein